MKKFAKVLLCFILAICIIYTPTRIPQFLGVSAVSVVEAAPVKINKKATTIAVGSTVKLKMINTKKKVTWSTSNKKVATVTSKGVVKGKKSGTTSIKAKTGGKTYTCKVMVKKRAVISKQIVTISQIGKNAKVKVTLTGKGKLVNRSSNKSVATSRWNKKWSVKAGVKTNTLVITAHKTGTTYIKLIDSEKGKKYKIKVVVNKDESVIEPSTYNITYVMNQGVNASGNPASYIEGTTINLIDPKREGYEFEGWYLDAAFTSKITSIQPETKGDLTLYAKWAKSEQLIRFENMSQVKPENVAKVKAFTDYMYEESIADSYLETSLPWEPVERKTNWIYYTGLVHKGFLMLDFERYAKEVKDFYTEHIRSDGSIIHYNTGELDSALPVYNILALLDSDKLTDEEYIKYKKAVIYTYRQLEKQTMYPQAGNLWLHSQDSKGDLKPEWQGWNICLDGIYMSQVALIKIAELIDDGAINITQKDGSPLTSEEIWNDIYSRFIFARDNLVDTETGLIYHGYSIENKTSNTSFWSRGMGWYTMALVEAAEYIPDPEKKAVLTKHYEELMTAIMKWQDPETFLWYNVTDEKENLFLKKGDRIIMNQPETSGSAMFSYCLLRGYHRGLLIDEKYRACGLRAYNAIIETKLTSEGLIDTIASCNVTNNKVAYLVSDYATNDGKGIGPLIMATNYAY